MFNDVFGDPQTSTYALLAAGYLCELIHHGITHWPRHRMSIREFAIRWRALRLCPVLAAAGATTIGAGYALMFFLKAGGL